MHASTDSDIDFRHSVVESRLNYTDFYLCEVVVRKHLEATGDS